MHLDEITQKLKSIENDAQHMIARNVELQADNEHLRELARAQQNRLNNIYESSAKAQYDAELWRKRYEAVEQYIQERLEITPASIPLDNVRLALHRIEQRDLHELN
ncbi:hypothetical protein [Staphylococcus arlettae]|uniref:hypothetical protein n=1 Tax=Staphylococcus arlettae TaxID=29378 RepID=UPI0021CEB219|nr:hypothetical protein [Staphylococcus arlettae]UXU53186.1 hypothetical protein MUA71_03670 [Staphylococcus arlettae]